MDILQKIIAHKIEEVKLRKQKRPLSSFAHEITKSERDFKNALAGGRTDAYPRLIAEIKKASPSEGLLKPNLEKELAEIVAIYNRYASAISVVTDEHFFQGKLEWIKKIRPITHLPILCKDFIIDEYQIYEARSFGADAILLIAAVLDETKLKKFTKISLSLGMNSLVEIHTERELEIAISAGAKIIGVNNRNLEMFEISLETTLSLAPRIPPDRVIVSESGFKTREDIKKMRGMVDAALTGTTLMRSPDVEEKLQELGFGNQR